MSRPRLVLLVGLDLSERIHLRDGVFDRLNEARTQSCDSLEEARAFVREHHGKMCEIIGAIVWDCAPPTIARALERNGAGCVSPEMSVNEASANGEWGYFPVVLMLSNHWGGMTQLPREWTTSEPSGHLVKRCKNAIDVFCGLLSAAPT
jgi:hypothetical protein